VANFYSNEALEKLADACVGLRGRCMHLQERCLGHYFRNARAKEFACHGLSRRLSVLVRCIHNTFGIIPPELDGLPTTDSLHDAEIQVQAFVFNVFGCLDNLAWIWVEERNVKNPKDGKDLPPGCVGLRPKNEIVMASLDVDVRKYLNSMDGWFEYLENYRHALAHQIPLYIPPYGPRPGHEGRCRELEVALAELRGDLVELEALRRELDQLILFKPYIMGSFTGRAKPMPFHWQMLCDFKTIEAISAKMLDALAVPA
jgi:hypothetical protein